MTSQAPPHLRPALGSALGFWLLVAVGLFLTFLSGWVRYRFGPVSFEEVMANLPITNGGGVGDGHLVVEAVLVCVVLPVLLAGFGFWLTWHKGLWWSATWGRRTITTAGILLSLSVLLFVTGVPTFIADTAADRSLGQYYRAPQLSATPAVKKNLITIYVESLESSYARASLFGHNLLSDLDAATSGWANYDQLRQYPTGGWTMAGMVGTQCGVPLKHQLVPTFDGTRRDHEVGAFLPGATCLGDLLATQGYRSVYLGGADITFAGKGNYYLDHGYAQTKGLADWRAAGEQAASFSAWGLSDDRLFAQARKTVDALHATRTPFNLTVLTLDTHEPPALHPECVTPDADAMARAVVCSTRAVAGFISHLKAAGYLADTVVMVMGDHLKMTPLAASFTSKLAPLTDRRVVLRIWSPQRFVFTRRDADQLSILPTTLELLGFTVPDGRAGLGVSFVGRHPVAGSVLAVNPADYAALLAAPSRDLYHQLWTRNN